MQKISLASFGHLDLRSRHFSFVNYLMQLDENVYFVCIFVGIS